MKGKPAVPFLAIGVAFLAIGVSRQRTFLGIGAAFLAIGVALLVRQERVDGSKQEVVGAGRKSLYIPDAGGVEARGQSVGSDQ